VKATRPVVVVPMEKMVGILAKTEPVLLTDEQDVVRGLAETVLTLTAAILRQGATLARLRRLVGGRSSEKTADVLGPHDARPCCGATPSESCDSESAACTAPEAGPPQSSESSESPESSEKESPQGSPKTKKKGHGRVPASAYPNAPCISVMHGTLRPGEVCPRCGHGRLYELATPAQILRIIGQPPLAAVCWNCQRACHNSRVS
jgi:transposase